MSEEGRDGRTKREESWSKERVARKVIECGKSGGELKAFGSSIYGSLDEGC